MVSVIISCYNAQDYILETVKSLLNQTYKQFEIIITDDGSTDQTLMVLKSLCELDERVQLIQTHHVGASAAKNLALARCRGEYIAVSDADDISYERRLQAQKDFLDGNPNVGLIGTNFDYINEKGIKFQSFDFGGQERQGDFSDYLKKELYQRRNPFLHSSIMFRRDLLKYVRGYDEGFRAALDYDFILRMSEFTRVDIIPEFLTAWRKHNAQITINRYLVQQENTYISVIRHLQKLIRQSTDSRDIDELLVYLKDANQQKITFHRNQRRGKVEKQHLYDEANCQYHVQKNYHKAAELYGKLLKKPGWTMQDLKACIYYLVCFTKSFRI